MLHALWYTVLNHGTLWYTVAICTVVQRGTFWCTALSCFVSLALCLIGQGQPHPCYGVAHLTNPSKSLHTTLNPSKPLHNPSKTPSNPTPQLIAPLTLQIPVSFFLTPPMVHEATYNANLAHTVHPTPSNAHARPSNVLDADSRVTRPECRRHVRVKGQSQEVQRSKGPPT